MTKIRVLIASVILSSIQVNAQESGASPLASTASVYGTAWVGGTYDCGVVYKVDQTGLETILYSFTGGVDGCRPSGNLITDSEGNLYGTTQFGGKNGIGTVFKLDPSGHETVFHNLGGSGFYPTSGLVRDTAGNLYGTTVYGGPYNNGTVYKLNANGYGSVLYTFTGGADGGLPFAGVILDSVGNLYGTTRMGGLHGFGLQSGFVR